MLTKRSSKLELEMSQKLIHQNLAVFVHMQEWNVGSPRMHTNLDVLTSGNSLLHDVACSDSYERLIFSSAWQNPLYVGIKRTIDVIGASALIVLLLPFLLLIALLVKLSSPGPIFYRWFVAGKHGRSFLSYKFRSMYANADEIKAQLAHLNEMHGPAFKITGDPRITPIGRWIRKYSIDELPQLYSVIKGDMSLVGPRPPLVNEYEIFTPFQRQKMSVRPGLTCIWQVNGRNRISNYDEWVRLDLEYIRTWSPWLDLKILLKTVLAVVRGSGK